MSQPLSRRLLAVVALLANVAALVLVAASLFDNLWALIVGVACLGLASMAMFTALVGRGTVRWIAAATSVVLTLVVIVDLAVIADLLRAILLVALAAIAVGATHVVLHSP